MLGLGNIYNRQARFVKVIPLRSRVFQFNLIHKNYSIIYFILIDLI